MDLQALKTELTTDPLARNYSAMADEAAANSLNVRDRQANRDTLDSGSLIAAIVRSEYGVLLAPDKDYLRLIALATSIPLTATVRNELAAMFPANSTTRANLIALLKQQASRGEELGIGFVTPSDVADARRI